METTTSYRKFLSFAQAAQFWLREHPDKTKEKYALDRVLAQGQKINTNLQEELETIDLEHCAVDDKGIVLLENDKFRYAKEELKKRNQKRKELLDDETKVTFSPHFVSEVKVEFSLPEIEAFTGFIFNEDKANELYAKLESDLE